MDVTKELNLNEVFIQQDTKTLKKYKPKEEKRLCSKQKQSEAILYGISNYL